MSSRRRLRRHPCRAVCRAALLVLPVASVTPLLIAQTASAQQDESGAIIFGQQQQKRNIFTLENTHAQIDFLYRYQKDSTDLKNGQPSVSFEENRFEEDFTLSSDAYIYHPNLVTMSLSGTFGLVQDSVNSTAESETQNGTIYEWDVSGTILRKEAAPVTLYSRRTRQLVSRELGPTLETTLTTSGAIWDIRSKAVPTRIEAYHTDEDQSGLGDTGDFKLSQNSIIWHSEARPTQTQLWSWDYTFNQIDQSTAGLSSDSFTNHDATLTHSIDFGRADKSNLTSAINYFNQSGDFPLERLHWTERLRLQHTDNFETHYYYTLDDQSYQDLDQLTNRGVAGFTHRLYKSLVTNADVGVEQVSRSDDANTLEYFADLGFDYRKRVPLGAFTGALGFAWDRQENDARSEVEQVLDDLRTFNDPSPIIIARNGIIPSSLHITDPRGLIVYTQGLDYTVNGFPDRVEIDRVIGGRIANQQSVLIDYQLQPQAGNTATTNSFFISGRYDIQQGPLRGLAVYTRFHDQNQSIDTDAPQQLTPNSFTDTVFGLEYRIWRITATAEQEYFDSTISPFDATRFELRYTDRVRLDTTLTLLANYTIINYTDENNTVDLLTLTGQVEHNLTRDLWVDATVIYRDEQDDLRGPTRGWEETAEIQWRRRQTSVYAQFRNTQVETDFQNRQFQFFELGIRRRW